MWRKELVRTQSNRCRRTRSDLDLVSKTAKSQINVDGGVAEKLFGDIGDEVGDKVVQTVTSETTDREMTFSGSSRPENVPAAVRATRLCVGAEWLVDKTRTRTKMPKLIQLQ